MRFYQDEAVVLRQHKLGEADRIIPVSQARELFEAAGERPDPATIVPCRINDPAPAAPQAPAAPEAAALANLGDPVGERPAQPVEEVAHRRPGRHPPQQRLGGRVHGPDLSHRVHVEHRHRHTSQV